MHRNAQIHLCALTDYQSHTDHIFEGHQKISPLVNLESIRMMKPNILYAHLHKHFKGSKKLYVHE